MTIPTGSVSQFANCTWPELRQQAEAGEGLVYIEPLAFLYGTAAAMAVEARRALPLCGGPAAFAAVRVWLRHGGSASAAAVASVPDVREWDEAALEGLSRPRAPFAGIDLGREDPRVMAVINVTPDSFSDGGDFFDPAVAISHGMDALAAGAAILDVGGESTRPGAAGVDVEEEKRRVLPVVGALAQAGAVVSIDTRRAEVMSAALDAGARIVNDVSALTADPRSLDVVATSRAPVILMHMQGEPATMQENPAYIDATLDIYDALSARIDACTAAGIPRDAIAIDPGIGFGKTTTHNLELIGRIGMFHGLGCALLLGVSRKSFIANVAGAARAKQRLPGSLAAGLAAAAAGVQLLRVHDVAATVQAVRVWRARNAAA